MKQSLHRDVQFRLSSGTLAAKLWGPEDGIPVLALHGWLDNANTFDLLVQELPGVRLLALDLAGHGWSSHRPPGASYYLWDHLADVTEVVQQLGWRRFTLMGHSMGAGIATWFAGTFTNMVERLVLIDGFGAPFSVEAERLPVYLRQAIRRRMLARNSPIARFSTGDEPQFSTFAEAVAERRNGKFGQLTEEAAAILLRRGLKHVEGGYRWRNDPRLALPAYMEPNEATIRAFIGKVSAPTCLILGKQGLFGQGQKAERLRSFRQLELHWLPGDHHLHLGPQASEVGRTIHEFLAPSVQPQTLTT